MDLTPEEKVLRDQFATAALQALVYKYGAEGETNKQINARKAYEQAEAMLAERKTRV